MDECTRVTKTSGYIIYNNTPPFSLILLFTHATALVWLDVETLLSPGWLQADGDDIGETI